MAASTSSGSTSGKGADAPGKDDLEAQVAALRADLSKLAETIGVIGKGKAEDLKGKAAERAAEARRMSEEALDAAGRHARELETELAGRIRERPFMAIGIAAGIGFIAALLARR